VGALKEEVAALRAEVRKKNVFINDDDDVISFVQLL
jgi:hypothetical protein